MKIRMGDVWDRTTEVLAGRGGILAGIAVLTLFLPSVVREGWKAYAGTGMVAASGNLILGLLTFVLMLWGSLALVAVASNPAVDQRQALALAGPRVPPALAMVIVIGIVFAIAAAPGAALLYASGFDYSRAQAGLEQINVSFGALAGFGLYMVAYAIAALWATARLLALYPVVQNERRGLGAIARSFALTRGHAMRIIGVVILYAIVFLVVLAATGSVFGIAARLLLGTEGATTTVFIVAIVGAVVTTVFTVLQSVFCAQYWVAATARDAAAHESEATTAPA